jgi:putative DNA-invertase from lambdoid prophage Rac
LETVRNLLEQGAGPSAIAAATGLQRQTIHRIRQNPTEAEAALARWEA